VARTDQCGLLGVIQSGGNRGRLATPPQDDRPRRTGTREHVGSDEESPVPEPQLWRFGVPTAFAEPPEAGTIARPSVSPAESQTRTEPSWLTSEKRLFSEASNPRARHSRCAHVCSEPPAEGPPVEPPGVTKLLDQLDGRRRGALHDRVDLVPGGADPGLLLVGHPRASGPSGATSRSQVNVNTSRTVPATRGWMRSTPPRCSPSPQPLVPERAHPGQGRYGAYKSCHRITAPIRHP
jgi:hypothetical protein